MTTAAFIFAGANAAATAIYRRGGTVATTFMIRCAVVYLWNATLVALCEGRPRLRASSIASHRKAAIIARSNRPWPQWRNYGRSSESLVRFTHFADGFTIFKGVDTVATVLLSRRVLGDGESLSLREPSAGALTLSGLIRTAAIPFRRRRELRAQRAASSSPPQRALARPGSTSSRGLSHGRAA